MAGIAKILKILAVIFGLASLVEIGFHDPADAIAFGVLAFGSEYGGFMEKDN